MTKLEQLHSFCNTYFSHPWWASAGKEPWIRISLLPSEYLKKKAKLPPGEFTILASQASEKLKNVIAQNDKGFDCYYFLNPVPVSCTRYAKNEDVITRLFCGIDIDYRLPLEPTELCDEIGLHAAAIIQTSLRAGTTKFQIIFPVAGDSDEKWTKGICRELCFVTGSDPVYDRKRIFRLPGLINWKGVGSGNDPVESRLVLVDENFAYEVGEVGEAVSKFGSERLSAELRVLGFRDVSEGGRTQGEKGDYGRWDEVLEAAASGTASLGEGSRHNALLSWAAQMAASRVMKQTMVENLRRLAAAAFSAPYDDEADLERIVRDAERFWDKVDREVDTAFEEEEGLDNEKPTAAKGDSNDNLPADHDRDSSGPGGSGGGESGGESGDDAQGDRSGGEGPAARYSSSTPEDIDESGASVAAPRDGSASVGVGITGEEIEERHIIDFAKKLALPFEGESREAWGEFLSQVVIDVNFYKDKDVGNVLRLGSLLVERLRAVGSARGRFYSIPLQYQDIVRHYSLFQLSEDQGKILVREFFAAVSYWVGKYRKEIAANPRVASAGKGKKSFKVVFAVKGDLLNEVLKDVLLRGASFEIAGAGVEQESLCSLQNGTFEVATAGSGKFFPNAKMPKGLKGVRVGLSWMKYKNTAAVDFLGTPPVGYDWSVKIPKFRAFLSDAFGQDEETWLGILRVIGYCLLPGNPFQKFFYFEGVAGGGKGTLAEIILHLAGRSAAAREEFTRLDSDAWFGRMEGKSVVFIDEAENSDARLHNNVLAQIKKVVGGEYVAGRSQYQDNRSIRCTQKFILASNKGLEAEDTAGGAARRIVPVNFSRKPQGEVVPRLFAEIVREEGSAIATISLLELSRAWPLGAAMFDVQGESFIRGRERFQDATAGLRVLLGRVVRKEEGEGKGFPSVLLQALVELWIEQAPERKRLLKQLDRRIISEMEELGFRRGTDLRFQLSQSALERGVRGRGMGFAECRLSKDDFLDALNLSERELISGILRKSQGIEKIRYLAESILGIQEFEFDAVSSMNGSGLENLEHSSKGVKQGSKNDPFKTDF